MEPQTNPVQPKNTNKILIYILIVILIINGVAYASYYAWQAFKPHVNTQIANPATIANINAALTGTTSSAFPSTTNISITSSSTVPGGYRLYTNTDYRIKFYIPEDSGATYGGNTGEMYSLEQSRSAGFNEIDLGGLDIQITYPSQNRNLLSSYGISDLESNYYGETADGSKIYLIGKGLGESQADRYLVLSSKNENWFEFNFSGLQNEEEETIINSVSFF